MARFLLVLVSAVAFRFAHGQSFPSCATSCALNAISSTGCQLTDFACICSATSFLSGVESCIQTACSAADQEATLEEALQLCAAAGVTITQPASPSTSIVSAPTESTPTLTTEILSTTPTPSATDTDCGSGQKRGVGARDACESEAGSNGTVTTTAPPSLYTGAAAAVKKGLEVEILMGLGAVLALGL